MNTRQLIWLAGAVIVLGILYFVVRSTSIPIAQETTLPQVDTADVAAITTIDKNDTVRLERTDNGWKLTQPVDWPANHIYVKQALRQIAEMQIESEVTSNPDRFEEYGVDGSGLQVTLDTGKKTVNLVLGNPHSGSSNSYARLAEDSTIYQVRGNPKATFSRKADLWRDRSIVTIPGDQIVRFAMPGLEMRRSQGQPWQLTFPVANDSVDSPVLDRRFDSVARLSATGFVPDDEAAKIDWKRSKDFLEVESVNGVTQRIHFMKADENRFYAKRNDEPTIFFVPKTTHDRIVVDMRKEILAKKDEKKKS